MAARRSEAGQLLIPMGGLLIVFGLLCAGYVKWCRALYWRMRMELVADATALSAARAQAQMLNRICFDNTMINAYTLKMRVPFTDFQMGEIYRTDYRKLRDKAKELGDEVSGFKSYPAGIGRVVARANGAEGVIPYFPFPMNSFLEPKTLHLLIYTVTPPTVSYGSVDGAFYVRTWKPGFLKAQPPHRTTWLVQRNGFRAISTARLWLDVPSSSLTHNGGFPRVRESLGRDALIQNFYAQFNARLAPRLSLTPESLLRLWGQDGGTSDDG